MITLRKENSQDHGAIARVNDLAFGRKAESRLIADLRKKEGFVPELSIIADFNGLVVGHLLFSPADIEDDHRKHRTLILAPMAVFPEYQKRAVGKLLMIYGLQEAKDLGYRSVIVLGHPSYYPRFGFRPASNWNITSPFPAPDEAFMALELVPGTLDGVSGRVIFPSEFDSL